MCRVIQPLLLVHLVPTNTNCADFPIAVYNHGTTLRKNDVPSNDTQETFIGKIFAAGGYFVCMPDYLGMGDSPGLHPYVHGESGKASIDMIRAAREFITNDLNLIDNSHYPYGLFSGWTRLHGYP